MNSFSCEEDSEDLVIAGSVDTWSGGGSLESDFGTSKDSQYGYWEMEYYVDAFKQRTDDPYLVYSRKIIGTFCNSAVNDRKLVVDVVVDRDKVSFFLYEYGDNQVKGYSGSSVTYAVTMRDATGKDYSLSATLRSNGDRLIFTEASSEKIRNAFAAGGSVSFYIVNNRRKVETYLFRIDDTSGFANAWNKLNGIEPGKSVSVQVVADQVYLRERSGVGIAVIPVGATVEIISYDKVYDVFYVSWNGRTGYLTGLGLSVSRDMLIQRFK